ncbi:MAG: copper homeostasis protein CutC [Flavobacteriaceae bacterium]|nr:copper homeostasis protein CutC [Flavobacteriaceae bacterium]|tara:strand:+ start:1246 stop:1869 length:624 start_codon:yes stop_codon:yes gene_type:complete
MIIEVCAESYEYALKAEKAGADRIELCKDLHLDGLTPDYETAKITIDKLNIPVFILIRPRKGDFIYSDEEFELMKQDILKFKEMGCKGIVSGVLNSDNSIDLKRTKELVELSKPLEFTFHRAFDVVSKPLKEIENLIILGVDRILTSGQKEKAINGLELLEKLKNTSQNRIKIMPGSGVSPMTIKKFKSFSEIHGSFTKFDLNEIKN